MGWHWPWVSQVWTLDCKLLGMMALNWFWCLRFFLVLGVLDLSSPSHLGSYVEKGEQKKGQNPICVWVYGCWLVKDRWSSWIKSHVGPFKHRHFFFRKGHGTMCFGATGIFCSCWKLIWSLSISLAFLLVWVM